MKSILSGSLILALSAGAAFAQEDTAQRDAERRVRFLKERLGLTDEQATKAVEIYKQNSEAEKKLEDERRGKLREILTDEQKTKYDEMLKQMEGGNRGPGGAGRGDGGGRGPGGAPGGGPGAGAFGWIERMLDGMLENLKTELALTEEQLTKTKAVFDELKKKVQENAEELRKNGFAGVDWQAEMAKFQEQMKEYGNKIREFLTDEQKAKYDKLVEELQTRGFGGGFGGRAPGGDRRGDGPRGPSTEERVKRTMDALKIEKADEAAAIKDLVQKVVEAQAALEAAERESRTKLDEARKNAALSEEEIANKIDELRKSRKLKADALREAQKALYEVITAPQEAILMLERILGW